MRRARSIQAASHLHSRRGADRNRRATLYRNPALRAVIEDHRHRAASANTITGLAADIAALRTTLEAIAVRVRRHEEQLRQLNRANTEEHPARNN